MFKLEKLVRKNIQKLMPYSSARHEFSGNAAVFLDANENSYGSPINHNINDNYNRYPDPLQKQLKHELSQLKGVPAENIFIGNGSDEVIDLAFRIFCDPGINNVIICPPTYGMYEVSANINDVEVMKVNLNPQFQLDVDEIIKATTSNTKLLFICSPNNPTGNSLSKQHIILLLKNFQGIIIIDEAYIDFSTQQSFISILNNYPNLLIMQTLSKAWGMASLRVGLAFASSEIIELFNKVKPPYNINKASQHLAIEALQNQLQVQNWITDTLEQRKLLEQKLPEFSFITEVFKSDANFLLIRVKSANDLYHYLSSNQIIVRNRNKIVLCDNCLRITIGTAAENQKLLEALQNYSA